MIVATYNIHRGYGSDGRFDLARIAGVIRSLDADVVGLQEVDSLVRGHDRTDSLLFLAEACKMTAVAGPALLRDYGGYGNGLLTRLPVVFSRQHDLSVQGREPRSVLECRLAVEHGTVTVLTTHLGLKRWERRRQVRWMVSRVGIEQEDPLIVLADSNEWRSRGLVRILDRALGSSPSCRSFPARFPTFALDRIWAGPPARVVRAEAYRSVQARQASDHLPVRAWIEMTGAGQDQSRLIRR